MSSYRDAFVKYSDNTDGKRKLAEHVSAIARRVGARRLLDLGAGEGTLTGLLVPTFEQVVAVDMNPAFRRDLERLPNTEVVITRMEEYDPPGSFDIVLLSYSLSGVAVESWPVLLNRLFRSLTPGGKILICSYREGCPWDRFCQAVQATLKLKRGAGTAWHRSLLRNRGFPTTVLETIATHIWADDLRALVEVLTFFFEGSDLLESNRAEVTDTLGRFVRRLTDGRVALEVDEEIIEVHPHGGGRGR